MTSRSEWIANAATTAHLSKAKTRLVNIQPLVEDDRDQHARVHRLVLGVDHVYRHLLGSDPELISSITLNSLEGPASNLSDSLARFEESKNLDYLSHAQDFLEQLLVQSAQLPPSPIQGEVIDEVVKPFREEVSNLIQQVREHSEAVSESVDTVTNRLEQISGEMQRLEKRSQDFLESAQQDSKSRIEVELAHLQDTARKAEELLGITAASGTAAAYQEEANRQARRADFSRYFAILGLMAAILIGYGTLQFLNPPTNANGTATIFFYIARTTLLAVAVALPAYAIRESSQHRARERHNRRLASELTTFRPFLAELPEAERNQLIKDASQRYFPGHESDDLPKPNA